MKTPVVKIDKARELRVELVKDKTLYVVKWEHGGIIPAFLGGYYTDIPTAQRKIRLYMQGIGCGETNSRRGKWGKDQARKKKAAEATAAKAAKGKTEETVLNG